MRKIQALLAVAAASLALAGTAAHADTVWHFTYTGGGVSASGSFETLGDGSAPTAVESITGTYTDSFTTNGSINLIPTTSTPYSGEPGQFLSADGAYYYNDLFNSATGFDDGGLLFSVNGTKEVNVFASNGGLVNLTNGVQTSVAFNAVAVPEPGSIAMLLAGVAALGFVSRRKARD
jgi:hypothetical protein